MNSADRELIRLAAQIYVERLKKWPDTEDDVRVTDSAKAAAQIFRECGTFMCEINHGAHDWSRLDASMNVMCSRCGVRRK